MKKLIFSFVFCSLCWSGYAQEVIVKKSDDGSRVDIMTKECEKMLEPSRVPDVGMLWPKDMDALNKFRKHITDQVATPEILKVLKPSNEPQEDSDGQIKIVFIVDKEGNVIASYLILLTELYGKFTEKQLRKFCQRCAKTKLDMGLFTHRENKEIYLFFMTWPDLVLRKGRETPINGSRQLF